LAHIYLPDPHDELLPPPLKIFRAPNWHGILISCAPLLIMGEFSREAAEKEERAPGRGRPGYNLRRKGNPPSKKGGDPQHLIGVKRRLGSPPKLVKAPPNFGPLSTPLLG